MKMQQVIMGTLMMLVLLSMSPAGVAEVGAAAETQMLRDELPLLSILNIPRPRAHIDRLSCKGAGEVCDVVQVGDCCPGLRCNHIPFGIDTCVWCPGSGYPCGLLDPCCDGLTCDGTFSGQCH